MLELKVPCRAKHTKFQPSDEEWRCPRCGADAEYFYIDEPDPDAHVDCSLLHEKDFVVCENCGKGWSGKRVAQMLQKKHDYIICPTCNGKGFIKRQHREIG